PNPNEIPSRAAATDLRRLLLAGGSLCLGILANAGEAGAMSLPEALAATYNNNPTLLSQRALLRQTDESVPQALANWRPTVTFTGSAGVQRNESNAPQPGANTAAFEGHEATLTPRVLDLSVVQPV